MSTFRFSGSQRRTAIIAAVVVVLVVGGLLLPPISVLERPGIVCAGTTLNTDSPAITIPNGLTVEYMPWSSRLFKEVPQPKEGQLTVPQQPGPGLEFDPQYVKFS